MRKISGGYCGYSCRGYKIKKAAFSGQPFLVLNRIVYSSELEVNVTPDEGFGTRAMILSARREKGRL